MLSDPGKPATDSNGYSFMSLDNCTHTYQKIHVGYVPLPTTKIDFSSDLERMAETQHKKKKKVISTIESMHGQCLLIMLCDYYH